MNNCKLCGKETNYTSGICDDCVYSGYLASKREKRIAKLARIKNWFLKKQDQQVLLDQSDQILDEATSKKSFWIVAAMVLIVVLMAFFYGIGLDKQVLK